MISQKGRKQLWQRFSKRANGKVWNCFFIYIFTFLKSKIHHYFVNFFKVSGRSVEEMLIDVLAYFFDNFFDSLSKNVFL